MTALDAHGQPLNDRFNAARRHERDISELLGMAKGMLADGVVNDAEADFLRTWGTNHPEAMSKWPASLVFSRLQQLYADGRIDEDERQELHELLNALVGGTLSIVLGQDAASSLPLDDPPPTIAWPNEVYVFTGKFAYATRHVCECEVLNRGGSCDDNVTRRTTYLVLGTFGSRDWRQTSYGRKIERAIELRASGIPLRIVGEDHWAASLTPFEHSAV